jgi:aromatic-L-amino-acid/L-tryptophan decarboxylase
VSTGAIDPLGEIAALCREQGIWFHVDGAYGAPAAALPDAPPGLKALAEADSVAIDPHKWLYAPLEAGCALVRDPQALLDAFTYRPPYYAFDEGADAPISFVDYGPQNSRGFRALKVWLGLRQVGREGYVRMLSDDIALAKDLHRLASEDPELEAWTTDLSITTFRYVPTGVEPGSAETEEYLNDLNREIRDRLEQGGETYLSNAVVGGTYLLRACIVNFRTTAEDIAALPGIVKRVGAEIASERRDNRASG